MLLYILYSGFGSCIRIVFNCMLMLVFVSCSFFLLVGVINIFMLFEDSRGN